MSAQPSATTPGVTPSRVTPSRFLTRVPLVSTSLPAPDLTSRPWPGSALELGDQRLHVRATPGPGSSAETAVYVHGLAGSATNWTDLSTVLGTELHGVALDLPGFGWSEPGPAESYTPESHAGAVVRALEALDRGPVHLVGNSFGGALAVRVAVDRPDLVRTLTLISPAVPDLRLSLARLSDRRVPLAYLPVVGRRVRRQLAAATPREQADKMLRLCFAEPGAVPAARLEQAAEEVTARRELPWAGEALRSTALGLARAWLAPPSRSLWSLLPRVSAPALVVWGSADRLMSVRKAARTARALPRGRLLVLPRTGHVAQMERPATVARAVLGLRDSVAVGDW